MSFIRNRLQKNNNVAVSPYETQALYGQPAYGTGLNNNIVVGQTVQNSVLTSEQLALQQQQFQAQTITNQPIVQETIRQDRVVEVQPVIHRDIERPVVNHIERHITEAAPLSRAGNIQHQAIVEERFHDRIVNEVQPIIHREIAVPQVEQIQQHYVERVVATPQHTRQVVYEPISSQLGQTYIQQGIGQQQFLQSGLVNAYTMQPVAPKRGLSSIFHRNQQQIAYAPAYGTGYAGAGGIPLATNQAFVPTTGLNQGLIGQQALLGTGLNQGVYGTGLNSGLYGQPGLNSGLYGTGLNQGLYGQPGLNTGLYGTGLNQGLYGQPGLNTGLYGQPGLNTGLNGGLNNGLVAREEARLHEQALEQQGLTQQNLARPL